MDNTVFKYRNASGANQIFVVDAEEGRTAQFFSFGIVLSFGPQTQFFVPMHMVTGIEHFTPGGKNPLDSILSSN